MTNEQFKKLKKVVNETQPNIDHSGKEFVAKLLEQMGISTVSYIVHSKLWFSFVLTDLSVLSVLTDSKLGVRVKWANKPRLVKQVMPEISTPTINTSSDTALRLADYLKAGYRLEDVREVKIVEGLYSAGMNSELYVGNSYKSSLVEVNTMTFDLIDISPAVVNSDFFIDEILVTDWQSNLPLTGAGQSKDCGKENKFISLEEWLQTKAPHAIKKARVKGTPIMSETIYLLTNDKCFLDDRTTKYHINQIEVR